MAREQTTLSVSGAALINTIRAWCKREIVMRLLGDTGTMGVGFMCLARMERVDREFAVEKYQEWKEAGCPIEWLDQPGHIPAVTFSGEASGGADAAASEATDGAASDTKPQGSRPRKPRRA